jgi:hypothetical protein
MVSESGLLEDIRRTGRGRKQQRILQQAGRNAESQIHTRTLTRKKNEEPHQAKEHFFLMQTKMTLIFLGKATFNVTRTFNKTNKQGNSSEKDEWRISSKDIV